jgi:hypothetical protein
MHRLACQRVRRRTGKPFRIVARSWEYQRRGVLHLHVILPAGTPFERHQAQLYVRHLAQLAGGHDFGHVDRGRRRGGSRQLEVIPPGAAASYLAKYLAPTMEAGKLSLSETALREDVPPLLVYVGRHLTRETQVTMRTLRLRRVAYHLAREHGARMSSVLEALLEAPPTRWLLLTNPEELGP